MPVVTTLMARGAFPDSHPQHLGMPGMHGKVAAVTALQKADLLVAIGPPLRASQRQRDEDEELWKAMTRPSSKQPRCHLPPKNGTHDLR